MTEHTPSTETVRARYYLATIPDDCPQHIIEMGRANSYEEFDRWLSNHVADHFDRAAETLAEGSSSFSPGDEPDVATIVEWLAEIAEGMRK